MIVKNKHHLTCMKILEMCPDVGIRGERVLIDSANRPNEQLVSQDPFKSDGSQGRTSPEGEP